MNPNQLTAYGGNNTAGPIDVSTAQNYFGDHESREGLLVAHSLRGEGFDASEDGTGRGTPLVPVVAPCLTRNYGKQPDSSDTNAGPMLVPVCVHGTQDPCHDEHIAFALGRNSGQENAIAFSCKDHGADAGDIAPTLRSMGHDGSHANAGGQVAVAVSLRGRDGGATAEIGGDVSNCLRASGGGGDKPYALAGSAHTALAVRRLTPGECERLQGFPDDYTLIPLHNKRPSDVIRFAADGPRYKALGNSMAVPCMAWIGRRIAEVESINADLRDEGSCGRRPVRAPRADQAPSGRACGPDGRRAAG